MLRIRRRLDRRRVGLLLLLAGTLFLVSWNSATSPTDFEQWACCGGPGGAFMAARGPAAAVYDEANGTTFAVFQCSHGHCPFAVRLRSDARGEVAEDVVLLRSDHRPPYKGLERMPEDIETPGEGRPTAVSNATVQPFDVASSTGGIMGILLGMTAIALGTLLAWGTSRPTLVLGVAGAVVGGALAWGLVAMQHEPYVLLSLVALGAAAAAVVGGLVALRRDRAAPLAVGALFFALSTFFGALLFQPFFPKPPNM